MRLRNGVDGNRQRLFYALAGGGSVCRYLVKSDVIEDTDGRLQIDLE